MTLYAQPKPTRGDRPKRKIDTSDLAFPKMQFERDPKYLRWVPTTGPCMLPNIIAPCGTKPDRAQLEACHMEHGGRGIKGSDASCARLCPVHHDMLDAEALPYQLMAFLWMKVWALREMWHRIKEAA